MTEQLTYTVAEAAAKLGITEAWYLRQLRARNLPGHKLGRNWRLTDDDIAQALELTAQARLPATGSPCRFDADVPTPVGPLGPRSLIRQFVGPRHKFVNEVQLSSSVRL